MSADRVASGLRLRLFMLCCCLLVACREVAQPACPYRGEPDYAPSAGCLVTIDDQMLLVEMKTGGLSPPGGKALAGESAQCAAHRETWEETGLDLMPRRLVRVFDTGFQLYRCDYYRNYDPLNGLPSEVSRALWLPLERFDSVRWRFDGQGAVLRMLAEQ